ncbi:hypothetical protein D6783_04535 [Candidatus Woesearchaeota archaeon]|nr:MAG: hypothetical protein D6783_04535 [Candidatus Woesearchaeota archaeon]
MSTEQTLIKQLEKSNAFQAFKKQHPSAYLAHLFFVEGTGEQSPEAGYYLPEEDKIAIFSTYPFRLKEPPQSVFKKEGTVKPLDLRHVAVSLSSAKKTLKQLLADKHPALTATKTILILQHLDEPIWNATLVTTSLQFLNVKISAKSGRVISDDIHNIMSLGTRK